MHDTILMHGSQSIDSFDQDTPDLTFAEVNFALFPVLDHFEKVTAICILHHKVERLRVLVNEGLFV